jgi:hypothetical protein
MKEIFYCIRQPWHNSNNNNNNNNNNILKLWSDCWGDLIMLHFRTTLLLHKDSPLFLGLFYLLLYNLFQMISRHAFNVGPC